MARRSSFTTVAALLVLPLLLAPGGEVEAPWPHGTPPHSTQIDQAVEAALELGTRERFEEELEAFEKGEDSEHIFVFQGDIDAGLHSHERLFQFGDSLFGHEFRLSEGYGDSPDLALRRVHSGVRGGLDTFSCSGCHFVGGPDGAGSPTQNAFLGGDGDRASSANVRNPPPVLGLGLVQALAAELTAALSLARLNAILDAAEAKAPVSVDLESKDISFGRLTAYPDGTVDTSEIVGVSPDLVVRPFGWKGTGERLRRFAEDAARVHFGIQSTVLVAGYEKQPDVKHLGPGPDWWDPDDDGKVRELEEGALTASAVYLALLETPVILPPHDDGLRERWGHGSALFDEIGCNDCHRREVALFHAKWEEWSDTTEGPPVTIALLGEGDEPRGTSLVKLFSDLRRHDVGPELADRHDNEEGIPRSVFLTRPLWGLAESAPYLHDGRAATIPEAILAHGGEAQESRDAFANLSPTDQADVHIFLLSLTREPKVRVAR